MDEDTIFAYEQYWSVREQLIASGMTEEQVDSGPVARVLRFTSVEAAQIHSELRHFGSL